MAEIARRDVFQAISDPTRRKIIDLVSKNVMNVSALTKKLKMSQPAVSQQLKFLSECGIVDVETIGRERYYKLHTKNLVPAFLWLEQYQKQWTARIDAFENYVNELQTKKIKK